MTEEVDTAATTDRRRSVADRLLDWLGDESKERPRPTLIATFAGVGGLLIAAGLLGAVAGDDANPRGKLVVVSLIILAAAWALRMFVGFEPLKSAAVGMAVVSVVVFPAAATADDGSSAFVTGAVMAALALALWALPGFRNRNILLAIGALALVSAFGSLADGSAEVQRCQEYIDDYDYDRFDEECGDVEYQEPSLLPAPFSETLGDQGAIYLAGAVVYLAATAWLDRKGRKGPATALAAAGVITAITGAIEFAAQLSGETAALFVLLVGLVVSFVGSFGARRATTWWGATTATVGLVWFIAAVWDPDSAASIGTMVVVSGVVLVAVAIAVAAMQQMGSRGAPTVDSGD